MDSEKLISWRFHLITIHNEYIYIYLLPYLVIKPTKKGSYILSQNHELLSLNKLQLIKSTTNIQGKFYAFVLLLGSDEIYYLFVLLTDIL